MHYKFAWTRPFSLKVLWNSRCGKAILCESCAHGSARTGLAAKVFKLGKPPYISRILGRHPVLCWTDNPWQLGTFGEQPHRRRLIVSAWRA